MTKKINFRKIETMIPEDIFISNIAHLIGNVKNVTLEVRFDSINSFEVDDTMFVLLEMHDAACNKIKGLMVGARDNDIKDCTIKSFLLKLMMIEYFVFMPYKIMVRLYLV